MSLHPIAIVDQVIEEYRSYLLTEFHARDRKLRAALEEALTRPQFLAQQAFFQAHRPFKPGTPWRDLGLDAKLARVMEERSRSKTTYLHQSESISHLLSPSATPLVVTTGTGSGKTECFLLPVIQNAIEDATRFKRSGLTALLVYPMNALANDQEARIRDYLDASGHTYVRVARYDRSTKEAERQALRRNPPHILLTNYMMLEYLLVRPADRAALFANHRCRFVVLDEVHTYRGSLGANIALLFRRLKAHLEEATQDWATEDAADGRRFPRLIPVATSATIKSVEETGRPPEEVRRLRDEAVQDFLSRLTGFERGAFRVLGEELSELVLPSEARWPAEPVELSPPPFHDADAVRHTLARLADLPEESPVEQAARSARILWTLNELLAKKPLSLSGIASDIQASVPERRGAELARIEREVYAALVAAAALPDGTPGALRLRTHRFIRGGWRFHRCVDPQCGRLYAMGEGRCACGKVAAPLYLCRSCGADTLRFKGAEEPEQGALEPNDSRDSKNDWFLYDLARFEPDTDGEEDDGTPTLARKEMKQRPVRLGWFDPATCAFAAEAIYPVRVALAPARNTCLVCGGTAHAHYILTPVGLGTSAAVRVLAEGLVEGLSEQNRDRPDHDHKERLLIFSDSRQDAAHQARFITYAGRYDRMRRRLVRLLEQRGPLTLDEAVQALLARGVELHDNPHTARFDKAQYLPKAVQAKAAAWEEAPLLDDVAVSAGYRATLFNLGLVGIQYDKLDRYLEDEGRALAAHLGITTGQMFHLARSLLDEMRRRGALSRPMLRYHPASPNCPEEVKHADWERRIKTPQGYAWDERRPVGHLDADLVPDGIKANNFWRRQGVGGGSPSLERKFKHLLKRMGGAEPKEEMLLDLLALLGRYVTAVPLHGYRKSLDLLQVDADTLQLMLVAPEDRRRCSVCNVKMPWAVVGAPCPACHGVLEPWPAREVEENRYVQRIRKDDFFPLVAGEHTAQVTGDERIELEEKFKAPPEEWPLNVLACSPTLEMGIDVGGLDAVVMRNIPPRPDNYAQRGGRAGRRTRVGIVLGYARSTPHDGYFYDKPQEMIAGEVPAPAIGLGNRDVVLRHLNAIVFGAAEPGLAGRMGEYLTLQGDLVEDNISRLLQALEAQREHAVALALKAWGPEILGPAGLDGAEKLRAALAEQPARIHDLFARVRLQILTLEQTIEQWRQLGKGDWAAMSAMDLKRKLLGIRSERQAGAGEGGDADDRSAGHPMRRFAEFGILPGYEFPSEPATLRLLGDRNEDESITVVRRFGLGQYQPEAPVHARGHRWRVKGLDTASPWNPKGDAPAWLYTLCPDCGLRFEAQKHVRCPRCGKADGLCAELPGYEFGGFVAVREDTPVLEEEDRFAMGALVQCHPQWDGIPVARFQLPTGWVAELRREEEVRWLNESRPPTEADELNGLRPLNEQGRGFYLCPACGRLLTPVAENAAKKEKGRKKARKGEEESPFGHAKGCAHASRAPQPMALTTRTPATTFRLRVNLPADMQDEEYQRWGQSLGYALRTGMRQLYMLDGPEIEFVLESMWSSPEGGLEHRKGALTFLDAAVGGSGFLERAARELHLVADRALDHLKHPDCETACYRCLKSYQNQRHHGSLNWPLVVPDLEALAQGAPVPLAAGADDVRPWLAAYQAGVGSPLEHRFLALFEQHGLPVQKQVPIAAEAGGPPISTADFVIAGSRVAIYIDGAAFHRGKRLRRDQIIRDRLRNGALKWTVVALSASELARGRELVEHLRHLGSSEVA